MKPFDLEKALKGEPVVTASGLPVKQFTYFDADAQYQICGVVNVNGIDVLTTWTKTGAYLATERGHENDLRMASKIKKGWILVCHHDGASYAGATIFPNEQAARSSAPTNSIAIIPIEWEE